MWLFYTSSTIKFGQLLKMCTTLWLLAAPQPQVVAADVELFNVILLGILFYIINLINIIVIQPHVLDRRRPRLEQYTRALVTQSTRPQLQVDQVHAGAQPEALGE